MGAGQSADAGSKIQNAENIQVSYYELLGIEKQASEDDIKKAYRRKALELHPDRNYGDVERATALFAEIQSAYQVLSDPQERAWYDSHEDAILHGGDPTGAGGEGYEQSVGLTTADDITRIMGKFNGRVEFSDAPSGFFGYLRDVFEKLAKEEARTSMQQDLDPVDYPAFGHKDDTHEDVVKPFYTFWAAFSSRKTFSWRDKYSMRDAEDRRMRRLIEKENKKFRDEALREFNDAVRTLLVFVRKRDPRYKPNTQSEEERSKVLRDASAAQAARMRAANLAQMDAEVIPAWATMREPDEENEIEEEESDEEQFECVACRKTFKSEKQFEAHEKSKKHQKAVQALRRQLQKEGVQLDLDEEEGEEETHGDGDEEPQSLPTPPAVNGAKDDGVDEADAAKFDEIVNGTVELEVEEEQSREAEDIGTKNQDEDGNEDDEEVGSDRDSAVIDDETHPSTPSDDGTTTGTTAPTAPGQKMGKAAQKRAKKAAQQQTNAAAEQAHQCAVCNAPFPSKSRLFQHIKDHNHAAPVSVTKAKGKNKKTKGK